MQNPDSVIKVILNNCLPDDPPDNYPLKNYPPPPTDNWHLGQLPPGQFPPRIIGPPPAQFPPRRIARRTITLRTIST